MRAAWVITLCIGCGFETSLETQQQPAVDAAVDASDAPGTNLDSATAACAGYTNGYRTSTVDADWDAAQEDCATSGGHLAVIADPAENTIVRALFPTTTRFWLGMNDLATENTWLWLDGTAVPRDAQYWDGGQPNDNQVFGGEDCGEMSNAGTWNDKTCVAVQPYVCECP